MRKPFFECRFSNNATHKTNANGMKFEMQNTRLNELVAWLCVCVCMRNKKSVDIKAKTWARETREMK